MTKTRRKFLTETSLGLFGVAVAGAQQQKPGEPPASWSFAEWLGSRSSVLILAAGMLAVSVLCFVVAGRIDRTTTIAENGAGGVRSDQGVL